MEWAQFITAFLVFFASHSFPLRPPLRPRLEAALGKLGFTLLYGVVSLLVLIWLIVAAGRAPFVPLWYWAPWQNHVALMLMALACLIAALGLGRPNPYSFGGRANDSFDARRAGIVRLTRHPLLVSLALWSLAHLIANGDLAHVILFGLFACFSALGGRIVDRRKKREMGVDWEEGVADLSRQPVFKSWGMSDLLRGVLAILLYVALIWLHPVIIGVSPLG